MKWHTAITSIDQDIKISLTEFGTVPLCSTFDAHFCLLHLGAWGSSVSPLGVVQEPKFGIIHGMTFAAAGRTSVNKNTAFGTKQ